MESEGCRIVAQRRRALHLPSHVPMLRATARQANAVKFFSFIELITLLAERDWLDEATKTIGQYWRRKNARRNGMTLEIPADATVKVCWN